MPCIDPFDGLSGVFADSLPDGWGRFLVDRLLLKNRIEPTAVGALNRLAIVGDSGMGALSYRPAIHLNESVPVVELDRIAGEQCSYDISQRDIGNIPSDSQSGLSSSDETDVGDHERFLGSAVTVPPDVL